MLNSPRSQRSITPCLFHPSAADPNRSCLQWVCASINSTGKHVVSWFPVSELKNRVANVPKTPGGKLKVLIIFKVNIQLHGRGNFAERVYLDDG